MTARRHRQGGAELHLFIGRKDLDNTVHGLGRAGGVQRSKDQVPCGSRLDGHLDRFPDPVIHRRR